MRNTTYSLLLAGATLAITLIGMDASFASADIGTMSAAGGNLTKQIGGSARLIKQGSVAFGALMTAGGVAKFYNNAKDGFKDGAKGFVVPATMALSGGMMMSLGWLTQVGSATIGDTTRANNITDTTGGVVGW